MQMLTKLVAGAIVAAIIVFAAYAIWAGTRPGRSDIVLGDASLWKEFDWAVSDNSATDPQRTVDMMRTLPTRSAGHTHVEGYDAVLLVPVEIDNVNPPCLPRPNSLGIDVDVEYSRTLEKMCSAYTARWHM
jgi:hypothetical protein